MVGLHGADRRVRAGSSCCWRFGFSFGAGEAGACPTLHACSASGFPSRAEARAQGIVSTSMLVGGAAAPQDPQMLIDHVGWRWSFLVFGVLGVAWAASFYLWFRDNPAKHKAVNDAEHENYPGKPGSHGREG